MYLPEYADQDAVGLARLIANKAVSVDEVRNTALAAIAAINPQINALVETWADEPTPAPGVLHGVPMLIKDLGITAAGRRNELGSALAKGCTAQADSELMARLRQPVCWRWGVPPRRSSLPALPQKAGCAARPAIPGTSITVPGVPAAVRAPPWRQGWCRWRMPPMAVVRSVCRLRSAACLASSPVAGGCLWGRRSTKSGAAWRCMAY